MQAGRGSERAPFGENGPKRCTTYGLRRLKEADFLLIALFVKIWYLSALKSCTFSAKTGIKGANPPFPNAGAYHLTA